MAGSISSKRVIEVLSRLVSVHEAPLFMRSDNGPEFVSLTILEWIAESGIANVLNDPGKPWQKGSDESFNGKLRDECLSIQWLRSRREAQVVIESWRQHYNDVRPHCSLQYLTPAEFKQQLRQDLQCQSGAPRSPRLDRGQPAPITPARMAHGAWSRSWPADSLSSEGEPNSICLLASNAKRDVV